MCGTRLDRRYSDISDIFISSLLLYLFGYTDDVPNTFDGIFLEYITHNVALLKIRNCKNLEI